MAQVILSSSDTLLLVTECECNEDEHVPLRQRVTSNQNTLTIKNIKYILKYSELKS